MSKFYVGQRVILVKPSNPENQNREGVIISLGHFPKGTITSQGPLPFPVDCVVDLVGVGQAFVQTSQIVCKCQAENV